MVDSPITEQDALVRVARWSRPVSKDKHAGNAQIAVILTIVNICSTVEDVIRF